MLILTRRIGEQLVIDGKIQITVLGVRGHQIRIGVDAPKDVTVHRKEVFERLDQDETQAAETSLEAKKED